MRLPASATPDGLAWSLPRGTATWDARRRLWWRPGLDTPLVVPASEVELVPTLDEEPVVACLATPRVVPPLERVVLVVGWPVVHVALGDARPFDRFRPGGRSTLLGDPAEGRLLAAAVVDAAPVPPPAGVAALRLLLVNAGARSAVVRRVAFPEEALTLWTDGVSLHAGDVHVRVLDAQAEAVVRPPDVPTHGRVLRPGRDGSRGSLLGWSEGRALGFAL